MTVVGGVIPGRVERTYIALSPFDGFSRTPPRMLSRREIARAIAVSGYPMPTVIGMTMWAGFP